MGGYSGQGLSAGPFKLASVTGVNGAALASTVITFNSNVSLSTHVPTTAIVKFGSGTLGIAVVKIKTSAGDLSALTALVNLTASNDAVIIQLSGVMANTGSISVEVTTASAGGSTFDVNIYGNVK